MVTNLSEVLKMVQNEKPQKCLPTVEERGDEREEEKEERVPSIRTEEDGKEEDREEEDGYTYYDAAQLEAVVPDIIRPIAASLPQEPHVLAVDDNSIERRVIETLLKASSCRVTAVESVARALDVLGVVGSCCTRVKASQINLIVTDYCMPGMTGYDLLKKVKSIPSLRDIPVVIMSSEDVKDRIDRCYAEGAKEFVLKPVKLVDVKRLRGHILPPKKVVTIEQPPLSIPIRGKRKLISAEALPSQNSDRHPRLEAVTVT